MASNTPLDRETLQAVKDALDAAWQDLHDWRRLAEEQRKAHHDPNHAPNMPSEAGIQKTRWILDALMPPAFLALEAVTPAAPPRVETETPRFRAAVTADYQAGYAKGSEDCRRAAKGRAIIQKAIDRHHQRTSPAPTPRVETETVPDYPAVFDELFGSDPALASPEPAQDGARETLQRFGVVHFSHLQTHGPMPDGYWTPWHIAQAEITRLQSELLTARIYEDGMPAMRDRAEKAEDEVQRLRSALAQAEQKTQAETRAEISRWYRDGVELASCGNSLPADDGTPHLWRSRGYQWFSANLRYQSERQRAEIAEAERDDARREAAALLARISGAL